MRPTMISDTHVLHVYTPSESTYMCGLEYSPDDTSITGLDGSIKVKALPHDWRLCTGCLSYTLALMVANGAIDRQWADTLMDASSHVLVEIDGKVMLFPGERADEI